MQDQENNDVVDEMEEFDAAFAESVEKSAYADQVNPDDTQDQETEGAADGGEDEGTFDDAFDNAAGDEPAAKEKVQEEEEPEEDLKAELARTKAEVERLRQSDRSQRGRVSALSKKLAEQKKAAEQPPQDQEQGQKETDDEVGEWEEFQREFPEMAAIVDKRLAPVTQQVQQVAATQDIIVEDQVSAHQAEIDKQYANLKELHSDVDEIKTSQEFATWRREAPEDVQAMIRSQESGDAAKVLDQFKEDTGWGKKVADDPPKEEKSEVQLINERREKALKKSAGISSKAVGRAPGGGDFDSAFEAAARNKEKQRSRVR